QALFAVVAELAHEVSVRVHDPDMLFRIVGTDLDVVRPAPNVVPLRPVFDHVPFAVEHYDDVVPPPIDSRAAIASVGIRPAVAGGGARGFAQRHPSADRVLDAGSDLGQPGCFDVLRKHGQL